MPSPDFRDIEKYLDHDTILKKIYEEHRRLGKKIAKIEKKPHLSPTEELEAHRLC